MTDAVYIPGNACHQQKVAPLAWLEWPALLLVRFLSLRLLGLLGAFFTQGLVSRRERYWFVAALHRPTGCSLRCMEVTLQPGV